MTHEITWSRKLDEPQEIEIRPVPAGRKNLRAGQLMLYPNGRAIDAAIRMIPKGASLTVKEFRAALARKHGADVTCPVTTGICLRTVAEAAYESFNAGTLIEEVAPVWRVLDARASTLKRVSFNPAFILDQRARESS